jgi:Chlorophyllase enzyme
MNSAGAAAQPTAPEAPPRAPDAGVDAAAAGASGAPSVTPPRAGTSSPPQPSAAGMNSAGPGMSSPSMGMGMPVAGSAGAPADAGTAPPQGGSMLPMISDPGAKGPFEIQVQESLEGLSTHIAIAPRELGRDGIKHPILVWSNGAGANSSSYRAMLDNVAAHGFFLLDDKSSSFESQPEVDSQRAAITWAIAQAEKQGGPYFGKLDTTRIAIAGHSLGSVSTFGNVKDTRIKTSIHMAGGITGNPEGVDDAWLKDLHVPTAFLCGDRDTNGLTRVKNDFAGAPPAVPLFFGLLAGVGHTDEFSKANGGRWGRVVIAWLRWQLAGDESFARSFVGQDCEFCKGDWTAMKHAIE